MTHQLCFDLARSVRPDRKPALRALCTQGSDSFEFCCEDGALLSVTFALDCCDREAIGWVATPIGYSNDDIRRLMLESVEKSFGEQLPAAPVQWLSDNGSAYTDEQTRVSARQIGLQPVTTPCCR